MTDVWKLYPENLPDFYTLKLFIIPSWYPTELHPESGTFFKERAHMLKECGLNVVVGTHIVHSVKDVFRAPFSSNIQEKIEERIPTYISQSVNIFPKMEKLMFQRYTLNSLKLFQHLIQKEGKPDAVWFQSTLWAGSALGEFLKRHQIPFMVSEHLKEFLNNDFSEFQRELIKSAYTNSSKIIATSNALYNSINKNYPETSSKLTLLPNPVDEDIFTLAPPSDPKVQNILCIAHFREEKRIDVLIRAFHQLINEGHTFTLKLAGKGPLKKQLEKMVHLKGLTDSVKFIGHLPQRELVEELHKTDILVLPSQVETFGMALIEAGACGVPVVATYCGGPKDIVTSETGILVEPESVSALKEGIQKMIQNFHQFDREGVRKSSIKRFGKEQFAHSIKEILQSILR